MAANPQPGGSGSSAGTTQEYTVRVPRDRKKKYKMMKFSSGVDVDFVKLGQNQVRMERENNLKEYKTAHDIDLMPKFGAGSEFGREQKEVARRKKYGIMMKKYDPNNQPWLLKLGKNKDSKKFKGVREGTISENTSYYIFTQCADGAFDAFPIEEWYNFSPVIKYKYLNSEEAEEEFNRRDKTMNYFSIMVRKRVKNEDTDDLNTEEGEKPKKTKAKGKSNKDFLLTDMDDWMNVSDDDDDDYDDDDDDKPKKKEDSDDEKSKKKNKRGKKEKRNSKRNSDDEAIEESDEGDFDDREVDYITDSDSSLSETNDREKTDIYEEKGVEEEKGLRKLIDSDESSEDEEKKEEENNEEKKEAKNKEGSESDSSSTTSDSDSDIEKEGKFTSAIFMQKSEKKRNSPVPRSETPNSVDGEDKKAMKRKLETDATTSKKMRTDSPSFAQITTSGGITEDAIRRYLMWKPMTAKELVQKFKTKRLNMTKEEMTNTIARLLKKINPDKQTINQTLYLSLKPDS